VLALPVGVQVEATQRFQRSYGFSCNFSSVRVILVCRALFIYSETLKDLGSTRKQDGTQKG
jgi:hypothetical protein